jgi:hypothetical protein
LKLFRSLHSIAKSKILKFIFISVLFNYSNSQAQSLLVSLNNSTIESFPLINIQSVKFGIDQMILYELNNTITTWQISDIDNYAFGNPTEVDSKLNITKDDLVIYPNPANEKVNILYKTTKECAITIQILDAKGNEVAMLFQGIHHGEQTYEWFPEVSKGIYYCKIISDKKSISKPIIIQ